MSVDNLLQRLESVRPIALGRWIARCPAHEDKSPSLSIREADDGKILINCFAGCGAAAVIEAVGLNFSDLMPPGSSTSKPGKPNHWHAVLEAFKAIRKDVLFVAMSAEAVSNGAILDDDDRNRLIEAAGNLRRASAMVR